MDHVVDELNSVLYFTFNLMLNTRKSNNAHEIIINV